VLAAVGAGGLLIFGCLVAALALPRQDDALPEPASDLVRLAEPAEQHELPAPARREESPAATLVQALERLHAPAVEQPAEATRPLPAARPARTRPATASPPRKPAAPGLVVKRRVERGEDDLLREIAKAPELALDRTLDRVDSLRMVALARLAQQAGKHDADTTVALVEKRPDLAGLPLRKGEACRLTPGTASHLQEGSLALRGLLFTAAQAGTLLAAVGGTPAARPDASALHKQLQGDGAAHNKWLKAEAIPALQQLLMAEHEAVREVLVGQLALIDGRQASEALAQRALFDLHPRVRERALEALTRRPAGEYRDALLEGFQHPWPAVAEHAAEAVVALGLKEAVPALLRFLDVPDPTAPFDKPGQGKWVKEMVRVNHLRNCLLCHAASTKDDDKVRGFVPPTNRPLPPAFTREYYGSRQQGIFVRADITYLKQDFSVPLPVKNPGLWPELQRFDFLVRERPATAKEVGEAKKPAGPATEHQKPLFFALRELTGKDPGPTAEDWRRLFVKRDLEVRTLHTGFKAARAVAADGGRVFVRDGAQVLLLEGDGRPEPWLGDAGEFAGLALDRTGRLLAASHRPAAVLRVGLTKEVKTLADRHEGQGFNGPRRLVADSAGGVYFTDDVEISGEGGSVYYLSSLGTVTRMPVELRRPRGVALSPDGKTLYIVSAASPEVMAYAVESAGSLGKGSLLCRLASSGKAAGAGLDVAVERGGNVCVLNAAARAVEVISPAGSKVGRTDLTEAPVACAVGGRDRRTLYVLTPTALLALDLSPATF
jgi:sugar lactone lactonase YvrE